MTLSTAINAGLKGILAHQKQVEVTGNNIANVNTPGYSRQTVTVSPSDAVNIKGLMLGQGVDVESVNREYDRFVSGQLIEQSSVVGEENAKSAPLAELERVLGIGEDSLAGQIEEFFGAWHDLSGNPSGAVEREQVIYKGQNLLDSFSGTKSDLVRVGQNINDKLNAEVNGINLKLREIAQLNASIKEKETLGHVANTDQDRRDQLVKELSGTIGVQTYNSGDSQIGLQLPGGIPLVQGDRALDFHAYYEGGELSFQISDGNVDLQAGVKNFGGKFKGLLDVRDNLIPDLQEKLGQLEHRIVSEVNAQHAAGYGLDGETGRTFFTQMPVYQSASSAASPDDPVDPSGGTTETLTVEVGGNSEDIEIESSDTLAGIRDAINEADAGVLASVVRDGSNYRLNLTPETRGEEVNLTGATTILGGFNETGTEDIHIAVDSTEELAAAGATGGAPGDNENALAVHNLGESRIMGDGETFVESYGRIASTTGTEAKRNNMASQGASDTMDQLENLRESIVGVSIEEEMMNLTLFQKGFEASSRFVQTVDEMMATIIGLKR
ncbi:MAG: flagellar hook-associated protein FlgK [Desulfobacteraceae bacterium]|nr:flagellar hook-associated protein FlgK [Desulfobacteraceae bacterium]